MMESVDGVRIALIGGYIYILYEKVFRLGGRNLSIILNESCTFNTRFLAFLSFETLPILTMQTETVQIARQVYLCMYRVYRVEIGT